MKDIFRPRVEPNRSIYDAFQSEAAKRDGREAEEWQYKELIAVYTMACTQATLLHLQEPTLDEVRKAELQASGHTDYGAKWACGVAEAMKNKRG